MNTPGNILVVDDEIVQQTVLATKLSMEGYTVTIAQNGRQALEFLRTQPFDVVLLDLLMPEMDGFQVLERMKVDNALQRYLAGERLEFIDPHHTVSMKRDGLSGREVAREELHLRQAVETFEKRFIARILEQNHGHTRKTAEILDIPLTTLYRKIKKYRL